MSHKNRNHYNNYSKMSAANAATEPVVNESELTPIVELEEETTVTTGPVIIEEPNTTEEDPIVPTPEEPIDGVVSGCVRLNVRVKPSINAGVIDVVPAGASLLIIKSKSTTEWYCVDVFGAEGYCMKKFVTLKK